MDLQSPIENAGRVFALYKSRLEKLGIETLEDLLYYVPFRYDDLRLISKIGQLQAGEVVTIHGEIIHIKNDYAKNWKKLQKAKVADETGEIDIIWFNQPFITKTLQSGDKVALSGKVEEFNHKLVLQSPDYEQITNDTKDLIHTGRLVPIYPETKGLSSKWLRRQIYKLIKDHAQNVLEYIPDSILQQSKLTGLSTAIEQIHFPISKEEATKARFRLSFDELFLMQLAAQQRRHEWEQNLKSYPFQIAQFQEHIDKFLTSLPFELTSSQKKAVDEIFKDLTSEKPMNRLLEGDVGSGKTVVAAIAMYLAHLNGFQSVLMAPTEILAQQHYKTISNFLSPFDLKVELVTGSKKPKIKNQELRIKEGNRNSKLVIRNSMHAFDVLIGTHAVLHDKVQFEKLGFVVIDEQQRFGVEQRAIIRKKGENPHVLTMTATPIPRTVALTMYGDLDLSYLSDMPKGRKKIKTWLVGPEKRDSAYQWIRREILETDSQVFIICPFIEESESMQTVKAASREFERLQKDVFPDLKLGMLHGKMKSKEKDTILDAFRNKEFDMLIATPVVEVGIDIANATIIVIEGADRFGLAQLHQLRGRVGRGDKQSYCLLFTESRIPQTTQRLKTMETIQEGAKLAEMDLKFRGSGEIYGTMQHGKLELKIANFSNFPLVEQTKREAELVFKDLEKYPLLLEKLQQVTIKRVSPD